MTPSHVEDIEQTYRQKGFSAPVGFGQRPAVLVVDAIVGFTDLDSPLAARFDAEIVAIIRLLDVARKKQLPAVFSSVAYEANCEDAGVFIRKVPALRILAAGSRWVEVDPRLERRPQELLLIKKYASCFFGTHLASYLTVRGIDTLLIGGFTTSGCIRATVVDAMQYGFRAIVPKECLDDRAEAPHLANLLDINAKYGDVVALSEALAYLEGF
jgi:nicotinamidase-related amidase